MHTAHGKDFWLSPWASSVHSENWHLIIYVCSACFQILSLGSFFFSAAISVRVVNFSSIMEQLFRQKLLPLCSKALTTWANNELSFLAPLQYIAQNKIKRQQIFFFRNLGRIRVTRLVLRLLKRLTARSACFCLNICFLKCRHWETNFQFLVLRAEKLNRKYG